MKITVKLTKTGLAVAELIKTSHGLTRIDSWGDIQNATLLYGRSYAGRPKWYAFISSGTNSGISQLTNEGASALLFIPVHDRYMIFIFGYGNQKLTNRGIERDFGIRVALNVVDPEKIKSIDSKKIENVISITRTQLSKEYRIEEFGFQINKDFLRYLSGKPLSNSFAKMVSGGDSLTMNCEVTSSSIQVKSEEILSQYLSTNYQTNYAWIDNVKSVRDTELLSILNQNLVNAFNSYLSHNESNYLEVSIPDIVDFASIDYFKVKGYKSNKEYSYIDISTVVEDLTTHGVSSISFEDLKKYYIEALGGNDGYINSWSLFNTLICEIVTNGKQFTLSDGEWFEISNSYFDDINNTFLSIIGSTEYVRLNDTIEPNEKSYLLSYTASNDEIILDRQLSYIFGSNNSIEIKDGSSSSKLSHLFSQAFVSASAFLTIRAFREDMREKLNNNQALRTTISEPIVASNFSVVLRVLKSGNTFSLPFFTKIILDEHYKKIKSMGFQFKLEWVRKA